MFTISHQHEAPRHVRDEREPRPARLLALLGIGALVAVSGCGGSSSDDGAASDDPAGIDLDLGGAEIDDDDVSAEFGDADVAMGTDLARPAWLDDWFQLPDGLEISIAVDDPSSGERSIQGLVPGGDAAAIEAQQTSMLIEAGYEHLGDSGFFVKPGETPIEVTVDERGDAVGYIYQHSFETEQTLRDAYAPVEGDGVLEASIGDTEVSIAGSCTVRSDSGQFTSDDGNANLTVEIREGEQDYLLGNVTTSTTDSFESWSVLQVGPSGEEPVASVRPDGFRFEGFMVDATLANPQPAVLDVACTG